jgi:hypothetical protein
MRRAAGRALPPGRCDWIPGVQSEIAKRLVWSGLLAGVGALASIATARLAAAIYRYAYGEDPPE